MTLRTPGEEGCGRGGAEELWAAHLLPNLDDRGPRVVCGDAVAVCALKAVYHQLDGERLLQNDAAENLLLDGELDLRAASEMRDGCAERR